MTSNQITDRSYFSNTSNDDSVNLESSIDDAPIYIREDSIPDGATTTCQGSRVLQNIIEPIVYQPKQKIENQYRKETLNEFGVTKKELIGKELKYNHRYDHVNQNKQLAGYARLSTDRV
jgi:hypothetical protein